jgi:hypothetical protein
MLGRNEYRDEPNRQTQRDGLHSKAAGVKTHFLYTVIRKGMSDTTISYLNLNLTLNIL